MKNLTTLYRSSLQAHTATTTAERNEAFRLRYQVYCLERGFEPPGMSGKQIETDTYDKNAIHFLTRYRATRSVLGVTRLVVDQADTASSLPIESHAIPGVETALNELRADGHRLAEVSRLAVTRDLGSLCRAPAKASVSLDPSFMMSPPPSANDIIASPARIIPQHISMGLLALLFKKSRDAGITHWVALLDAALVRCYSRFGIQGRTIGPAIEHRGLRQPVLMKLSEVWGHIQERCPPLAKLIQEFSANAGSEVQGGLVRVLSPHTHMPLHLLKSGAVGLQAQL